jgi:transposase
MSEQRQKIYSTEFKESSVKLAIESGQPIAHTARELGINPNTLYTWINKYSTAPNTNGFKVHSDNRAYDEIMKLKKELARVSQERDILKKATAYFAKESR